MLDKSIIMSKFLDEYPGVNPKHIIIDDNVVSLDGIVYSVFVEFYGSYGFINWVNESQVVVKNYSFDKQYKDEQNNIELNNKFEIILNYND